jgi:hypothetical protein
MKPAIYLDSSVPINRRLHLPTPVICTPEELRLE